MAPFLLLLSSLGCAHPDCGPGAEAALQRLQEGSFAEAKRLYSVALLEAPPGRCRDQTTAILASLSVAELSVYKALAAHAVAALHNPVITDDDGRRWTGVASYSLDMMSTLLASDGGVHRELLQLKARHVPWQLPGERLVAALESVMNSEADLVQAFSNGQWHSGYNSPTSRADLAFILLLSSCQEYWDPSSQALDTAGILSDLGNTYLFLELLPQAEEVFRRVLDVTHNDEGSPWRAHAKYGLQEVQNRSKQRN